MDLEEIAPGVQGTFELEFEDFCLFCAIIFELVRILYYIIIFTTKTSQEAVPGIYFVFKKKI